MQYKDNFSNEERYRLFRNMYEVVHPSISKKNISSYRIVLNEDILPIRVYYPKKISSINSVILFVPGEGNISNCYGCYEAILKDMAIRFDKLVVAIDYFDEEIKYPYLFDSIYNSVDFIINELDCLGIGTDKITFMGDSFGASLVSGVTMKRVDLLKSSNFKEVLFYPILSGEYFGKTKFESLMRDGMLEKDDLNVLSHFIKKYVSNKKRLTNKYICPLKCKDYSKYPDTLVVTADLDILRDEGILFGELLIKNNNNSKYYNVLFGEHGFLDFCDEDMKEDVYSVINDFVN